jgi:CMP-N-acetylneuraminic acid synthetase
MKTIKYLAIIPARGGSKRLPRKNILLLQNKPLIYWSIDAALKTQYINEVIVTTDDIEIAEISKKYGAKVPFIRPNELANDTADSVSVVLHVIEYYKSQSVKIENIILLQPTSPLRTSEDISLAIELFEQKNADSIISVCPTEHSPLWCNTLPEDLSMDNFINPKYKNTRSQDLPIYYRLNGAIYIIKSNILEKEKSFNTSKNSYSYIMSNEKSIDIDTKLDFIIAEQIMNDITDL